MGKVASVAKTETEYAQFELAEAERLKNELLGVWMVILI